MTRRTELWLAPGVLFLALIPAGVLGLWGYMSATATPIHPDSTALPSTPGPEPPPGWTDAAARAREIVRTTVSEKNLPGVSVAVGAAGDLVWAEGFGWADLERRVPVAPDTRFRIGTASIVLTSAGVGLLLDRQRLSLAQPIRTYVLAYPEKPWPVTLRQVMGHTSGIRADAGDEEPLSETCERPADGLRRFAGEPLLFEPGSRFRYSSYGWVLVSAAVEAAAGEPFAAFMNRQVFEPLGMRDTSIDSPAEPMLNPATFYFPRFAADPRYGPQPPRAIDLSCLAGAAAFLSTPSDLVRFALGVREGRLLRPATVQLLQTSQRLPSGGETGYGLGWDLETVTVAGRPTPVVGHDGDIMSGPVATLMVVPEHAIVVAVTSNTAYADTAPLAARIAEAFAVKPRTPPS
jgi:CubicO group peptidase (beta-lactamase class C family)